MFGEVAASNEFFIFIVMHGLLLRGSARLIVFGPCRVEGEVRVTSRMK